MEKRNVVPISVLRAHGPGLRDGEGCSNEDRWTLRAEMGKFHVKVLLDVGENLECRVERNVSYIDVRGSIVVEDFISFIIIIGVR